MATAIRQPDTGKPIYYSAEMVDALNAAVPGRLPRYECVYGELLVTKHAPRPWHHAVLSRLYRALDRYAEGEPAAGYVGGFGSTFRFGRDDVNVDPDLWVVRADEWRTSVRTEAWDALTVPLLLVEVISPSSRRRDRFAKRRAYMDAGVPLYWIVDGDNRWVEVWTPGAVFPTVERERLVWRPEGAAEPFVYPLAELFAPV